MFLAPATGGDFSTLRNAVRGRPGVFVEAVQDLNFANGTGCGWTVPDGSESNVTDGSQVAEGPCTEGGDRRWASSWISSASTSRRTSRRRASRSTPRAWCWTMPMYEPLVSAADERQQPAT